MREALNLASDLGFFLYPPCGWFPPGGYTNSACGTISGGRGVYCGGSGHTIHPLRGWGSLLCRVVWPVCCKLSGAGGVRVTGGKIPPDPPVGVSRGG